MSSPAAVTLSINSGSWVFTDVFSYSRTLPCSAHLVGLDDGANEREEHVGLKGAQPTGLHHPLQSGDPATWDQPCQLVGGERRGGEGEKGWSKVISTPWVHPLWELSEPFNTEHQTSTPHTTPTIHPPTLSSLPSTHSHSLCTFLLAHFQLGLGLPLQVGGATSVTYHTGEDCRIRICCSTSHWHSPPHTSHLTPSVSCNELRTWHHRQSPPPVQCGVQTASPSESE